MKHLNYFNSHSEYTDPTVTPNVSYCKQENEVHYNPKKMWANEYFTIESLEDNNTIYLKASNTAITKTVSASTDNGATWTEYTSSTGGSGTILATLNNGDKLLLKGENSTYAKSNTAYNQFNSTGQFKVKGNIMSLISGDSFANADELTENNTFSCLLRECTGLTSAENLVLPATTLTGNCYAQMFQGCTSLTTAPELPATTLATYCYQDMFKGCTNLSSITCLATNISATNCTQNWVRGVAASGTFTKAASMSSWTTGVNGIPTGWTVQTASN